MQSRSNLAHTFIKSGFQVAEQNKSGWSPPQKKNKCIAFGPKAFLYKYILSDPEMTEGANAQSTCGLCRCICLSKLHLSSTLTLGLDQNTFESTYIPANQDTAVYPCKHTHASIHGSTGIICCSMEGELTNSRSSLTVPRDPILAIDD